MRLFNRYLALFAILAPLVATAAAAGEPLASGDVRRFGAKGDGAADDTAAIQRAVDSRAGDIVFPRGSYRITSTVVVDLDRVGFTSLVGSGTARIVMAGAGPAFRFVGTHEGSASPTTFKPHVWQNQRMPTVDGLEIIGDNAEACGIEATGTMELTVTRLHVREALHGIVLANRNRNVIIANCHLYHNRGAGVLYDNVDLHQSNITGCHISYNGQGGVVARGGAVRNLHITGCDIESNMAAEGPPSANIWIDGSGSRSSTAEIAVVGCTIQHTHKAPDSANIRYIGNDNPELRWGHFSISANVMSDSQINVDLRQARDVVLTGNTFWSGVQHDIRVVDSSHVVLGANVLDRNPQYSEDVETARGVVFRNCDDCTITGLHMAGAKAAAGVMLENCRRFNISGCTVLDCAGAAVALKGVTRSRLSDCLLRNDLADGHPWQPVLVDRTSEVHLVDNALGPSRQ